MTYTWIGDMPHMFVTRPNENILDTGHSRRETPLLVSTHRIVHNQGFFFLSLFETSEELNENVHFQPDQDDGETTYL